jgi:hypothetical protein
LVAVALAGAACGGHKEEGRGVLDASSVPAAEGDAGAAARQDASTAPVPTNASPSESDAGWTGQARTIRLPPENGGLDYQLGGAYALPAGVTIVSRDKSEPPAAGAYNVCYINGFQTQPDEESFWMAMHPELLLRDAHGGLVKDEEWHEYILDVTTPEKRAALVAIERRWIEECAATGYDAVEVDNLDTYSRSGNRITEDNAVALLRALADIAHGLGLAIAQKNSTDVVGRRAEMGTDFAVAEQCSENSECDVYTEAYGKGVLMIEYQRSAFQKGCREYPDYPIVFRDSPLVTPNDGRSYVFEDC